MTPSPRFLLSLAVAALGLRAAGAVPPPEKLLPKDTMLVLTAPDWGKAVHFWNDAPYSRLWQDPALKPFKDKFVDKFTTAVIRPLEQNWGIKFSDYAGLAQGQVTYALVPIVSKVDPDKHMSLIMLIDTKDHAGQLKANLAQITKKWADAGKPMKAQKIRGTDFTTLMVSPDDLALKKILPSAVPADAADTPADKSAAKTAEVTLGQSDSLLLVSDSTEAIDKVLSRQAEDMSPPLADDPAFQADYGARLRESPFYAWLNVKALIDLVNKAPAPADANKPPAAGDDSAASNPFDPKKILAATGLANLTSASVSYQNSPEGNSTQLFLAVEAQKRPALLKIFAADAKDSSPPSFVPADAIKFFRWRLNMARSWKELENMLGDLIPAQYLAGLTTVFQMAGKDKDEHYDLKSELLNNLGDDIISYEKPPKGNTLADLKAAPSIVLVASPNPDKLTAALKVLLSIPFQGAPITDREFLGRKIYTAAPPSSGDGKASSGVSFSANGGYIAISGDTSILEEYLRGSEGGAKALGDLPGLADAAQKVGGMSTGLFGFENENQTMRPVFDVVRKQHLSLQDMLGVPLPPSLGGEQAETLQQWADFSLLPPFDTISKYFYFSVYSGSFSSDGFSLKVFMPTPPQLRQ
ncbi:MAG TPA: hypothetical protein VGR14_03520 [Verrucomicrobiae bacterium]|nr:hypothetical protein [Verrucomicrobiae bacterium]